MDLYKVNKRKRRNNAPFVNNTMENQKGGNSLAPAVSIYNKYMVRLTHTLSPKNRAIQDAGSVIITLSVGLAIKQLLHIFKRKICYLL